LFLKKINQLIFLSQTINQRMQSIKLAKQ